MRMTKNKRRILEALRPVDDDQAFETGQAPFPACDVAKTLGLNLSNVSRTLRAMERQGLVIRERRKVGVLYDLNGGIREAPREVNCYWNAAHLHEDQEAVALYRERQKERSQKALEQWGNWMLQRMQQTTE